MGNRLIAGIIFASTPALCASTATASTVSHPGVYEEQFVYTGGPGESNSVTITQTLVMQPPPGNGYVNSTITVEDPGHQVYANGEFCVGGFGEAVCTRASHSITGIARLGDGEDSIAISRKGEVTQGPTGEQPSFYWLVNGGPGDDVLSGAHYSDIFIGGPGADVFLPNPGDTGSDVVRYKEPFRDAGVTVTLNGVADDGAAGEGDNVDPDIDRVDGTRFADRLVGPDATEFADGKSPYSFHLSGGRGADVIVGGSARRGTYSGGGGRDRIDLRATTERHGVFANDVNGGQGRDVILSRNGIKERISCGSGLDKVLAGEFDDVDADCEIVKVA